MVLSSQGRLLYTWLSFCQNITRRQSCMAGLRGSREPLVWEIQVAPILALLGCGNKQPEHRRGSAPHDTSSPTSMSRQNCRRRRRPSRQAQFCLTRHRVSPRNSGDTHLIRVRLGFRAGLLRLEDTTHHLLQPSKKCLVPERPTRAHVLAQVAEFLFGYGTVEEHIPIADHRQQGSNFDKWSSRLERCRPGVLGPIQGVADQQRTHGVQFDIPRGCEQARLVHDERGKSP